MPKELKVIQDFYDFMLWLIQHTEKFPRHHRYSLGLAMENRLHRILELLLRAKFSKEKAGFLNEANMELEVLRFQVRLATDLKALPMKSHAHAAQVMQGIGSQIGGWLSSKATRAPRGNDMGGSCGAGIPVRGPEGLPAPQASPCPGYSSAETDP
jgi:hypothetical protein